jgi:hypothetical protein
MNESGEPQTPGMDFVADDTLSGFRLQHREVFDRDAFYGRVWSLDPAGKNALPTGDIRETIRGRITRINASLSGTDDVHYSQAKFLHVKQIIERFRGRDGLSEQDRRWTAKFTDMRTWIAAINALRDYRIVRRTFRHPVHGTNRAPDAVWIDSLDDALVLPGKHHDTRRFGTLLDQTRVRQPVVLPWLAQRLLQALSLLNAWPILQDVVDWMQAPPRPGIYLRQVDTAGRDTDMTLDGASFARLDPPVTRVVITENDINFLGFPLPADSLMLFGAGYGFDVLRESDWLSHSRLHYRGDIDTHGLPSPISYAASLRRLSHC